MAATEVPFHFRNIYRMDNLEGVKKLLRREIGGQTDKFETMDYFQIILALSDGSVALEMDAKEVGRRLNAVAEGTIKEGKKLKIPMDKYYAALSGLQQSTVYCAEDPETGKLLAGPDLSREGTSTAFVSLARKPAAALCKGGGKVREMKMDDFILRCADEGWKWFELDSGTSRDLFTVEEYEEAAVTFDSARKVVNRAIGAGISGDLLFPALVTYMSRMMVDVRLKDGSETTGVLVSLADNMSTRFTVLHVVPEQDEKPDSVPNSIMVDQEDLEWLRVHMSPAPDAAQEP